MEWSGVNTKTIFNGTDTGSAGTPLNLAPTTTDADGILLAAACFADEATAITMTTGAFISASGNTGEGQSGAGANDIRYGIASIAVDSASASEDIEFAQTGSISSAGVMVELNPA